MRPIKRVSQMLLDREAALFLATGAARPAYPAFSAGTRATSGADEASGCGSRMPAAYGGRGPARTSGPAVR